MALIVEDGTGVSGAESYASTAYIDTYWANRTQNALSSVWTSLTDTGKKEGAAREATQYIEGMFAPYFRGLRRGWVQGLEWPRTGAFDGAEALGHIAYELPDMPDCLPAAVAELAVRSISGALAPDLKRGGAVTMQKAGPVEIQYEKGAPVRTTYGVVSLLLAPILDGSQPNAPNPHWAFA